MAYQPQAMSEAEYQRMLQEFMRRQGPSQTNSYLQKQLDDKQAVIDKYNADPKNPSASTNVGQLTELDAQRLHDRYSSPEALAAYRGQRSPETSSIIAGAMDQAKGINAAGNMAMRQNATSSVNSQNQMALRALRGSQAANGVRGGLAQAQAGMQQGQATAAMADANRNIIADNIKYKQAGLQNAASIVGNQENIERDMGADRLGTVMAARAENAGLSAAQMQAQAAAMSGGGGGGRGKLGGGK